MTTYLNLRKKSPNKKKRQGLLLLTLLTNISGSCSGGFENHLILVTRRNRFTINRLRLPTFQLKIFLS